MSRLNFFVFHKIGGLTCDIVIQWNLVNSKSSGLKLLVRIISSSNYRALDAKIYSPQNDVKHY